uniref:Uncharacterized protein n=1 Tax=Anopheles epiroticus TaxID=199890 RepID=A0A182PYN9_9DIPT
MVGLPLWVLAVPVGLPAHPSVSSRSVSVSLACTTLSLLITMQMAPRR